MGPVVESEDGAAPLDSASIARYAGAVGVKSPTRIEIN